jgi:hypothetical protein
MCKNSFALSDSFFKANLFWCKIIKWSVPKIKQKKNKQTHVRGWGLNLGSLDYFVVSSDRVRPSGWKLRSKR